MLLSNVRTALRVLRTHRLRSALTMLGIVIGVAAVVTMNAIGSGARERVAAQIRSLGANLISINPGSALMSSVRTQQLGATTVKPKRTFAARRGLRYTVPTPKRKRRAGDRAGNSRGGGGRTHALLPNPVFGRSF